MSNKTKLCTVALILFSLCNFSSAEETSGIGFELAGDFYSKYIWRGQNLNSDYVFQAGASATWKEFTVGIWGNMNTTDIYNNEFQFSELDYSLDYSSELTEGIGYSLGIIYYDFPSTTVADTTEVYGGLSFDLPLSPSITVYKDVDEAEGVYVSLGIEHSFGEVAEGVGMDFSASTGWGDSDYNEYYWGVSESKMNDLTVSLSFPMELGGWSFTPSLNYTALLSSDLKATDVYSQKSNHFYTGFSFSKSF